MFKKPSFVVTTVSCILLLYCILIGFHAPLPLIYFIFGISPFLMLWMVFTVIRHGIYYGKELEEDEEWGYQDKGREELGVL